MTQSKSTRERLSPQFEDSIIFNRPLFSIAYIIWLIVAILNTSSISKAIGHNNLLYYMVPILLILHELTSFKVTLKDFLLFLTLAAFNIMTYMYGGNDLLAFSMFLFCGRYADFRSLARITFAVELFMISALFFLASVGAIPDVINIRPNGTIRHSLGFEYVTYLPYYLINLLSIRLYLLDSKISILEVFVWIIVLCLAMVATDARNSCLLAIAMVVIAYAVKLGSYHLNKNGSSFFITRLGIKASCLSFIVCMALFFLLSFFYTEGVPFWDAANSFFSMRLWRTHHAMEHFGFPIIGGTGVLLQTINLVIDDSYMRILYDHGLLFLFFVIGMYTVSTFKFAKEKAFVPLLLMVFLALHSISDAQLISLQQNTLLLLAAQTAFGYASKRGDDSFVN